MMMMMIPNGVLHVTPLAKLCLQLCVTAVHRSELCWSCVEWQCTEISQYRSGATITPHLVAATIAMCN
jgi:hypothetical protein